MTRMVVAVAVSMLLPAASDAFGSWGMIMPSSMARGVGSTRGRGVWASGPKLRVPGREAGRLGGGLCVRMSEEVFEKDVVEFFPPEELWASLKGIGVQAEGGVETVLGAVVELDSPMTIQPLCVREEGSTELYGDSRLDPIAVDADGIVKVMDTFPSQRPVPSLGGGIGYGAEGVDCWELQEPLSDNCLLPLEDTGMGFHQKGW